MTNSFSAPGAGTRISATVKWYDPARGYGFVVPADGSSDIHCRQSVLAEVGLDTLLAGATVACETAQALRGPEVSRILAVDFSTVSPRTVSLAGAPGYGSMAAGPGAGRADHPGPDVRATVKWFHAEKGYGFLEPEDGSADLFYHVSVVQTSGYDTLPEGTAVTCTVAPGDRGPQVSRNPLGRASGSRARVSRGQPVPRCPQSGPASGTPHRWPSWSWRAA